MSHQIKLKYSWNSEIDALDLASSVMSFWKLFTRIVEDSTSDNTEVRMTIKAFNEWSFDIFFWLEFSDVVQVAQTAATVVSWAIVWTEWELIDKSLGIIDNLLKIYSHLRGRPARKIEQSREEPTTYNVENQNWQVIQVHWAWSTVNYIWKVDHLVVNMVAPLKNASNGFTGMWIFNTEQEEVVNVTSEEWGSIECIESTIANNNTEVLAKVIAIHRNTGNWKAQINWTSVSISFSSLSLLSNDFINLATWLWNGGIVKLKWTSYYNERGMQLIRFDVTGCEIFEQRVIEE